MKKYFISGVLALAVSAVFTGCSKNTDLYDAEAVQKNQNEQKVAELRKAYNEAFTKEFGGIASNNAWGFDKTRGSVTRTASTSESELWIIPERLWGGSQNKEGWNANEAEAAIDGGNATYVLNSFNFNNYFIQHVEKAQNGHGSGNVKSTIESLQAWSSKDGEWQDVTNFNEGDNPNGVFVTAEKTYFFTNPYRSAAGTTLMKDMGGAPCNKADENNNNESIGKMFRLKLQGGTYSYDYTIQVQTVYHKSPLKKDITEPLLAFRLSNGSYWVMRLAEADNTTDNVVAEGRIFCEDMGANDFDFNDVVFDAKIMGNGEIKITVLAHGGTLDISVADVKVTLPAMTNTGLADAPIQEFTIPAKSGGEPVYKEISEIPVKVVPNGDANNAYDLTAVKGQSPQKVCVPVNTLWPDEYVQLGRAYTPFGGYVNISNPADWTYEVVPYLIDGNLNNNN